MIVGVGRITSIGDLQEWDYDPPKNAPIHSYLWERSVCHSKLAYHCWEAAGENGDPWPVLAALVNNPRTLPGDLKVQVTGFTDTWKYLASQRGEKRLALAKLLAQFDLTFDQAARWWDRAARNSAGLRQANEEITDAAILKNPYALYECDRLQPEPIAFRTDRSRRIPGEGDSECSPHSRTVSDDRSG